VYVDYKKAMTDMCSLIFKEIFVDKQLLKELEYELQHAKSQRDSLTPTMATMTKTPTQTSHTVLSLF
jgi:hypothetical protein